MASHPDDYKFDVMACLRSNVRVVAVASPMQYLNVRLNHGSPDKLVRCSMLRNLITSALLLAALCLFTAQSMRSVLVTSNQIKIVYVAIHGGN